MQSKPNSKLNYLGGSYLGLEMLLVIMSDDLPQKKVLMCLANLMFRITCNL